MGIISKQVVSGLTELSHPLLQADACINHRQRRTACHTCTDLCPEQVFTSVPKETPNWLRCTDCDRCVSACPSRALASSMDTRKKYLEGRDLSHTLVIGCRAEQQPCQLKVACVAALPWELLAYLALHTKVVLYLNACAQCDQAGSWELLRQNLKEVLRFVGEDIFQKNILLIQGGSYQEEAPSYSRRDIFSNLSKAMTRAALELVPKLPGEGESDSEGLFYRYLLADTVYKRYQACRAGEQTASSPIPTYPVSLPKFTENCHGCGSCITLCPGKALQLSEPKDGVRTMYITPWRCTACGLCSTVCRSGGVETPRPFVLKHMHQQPLVNLRIPSCPLCGGVIPPGAKDGLCIVCSQRQKRKRVKR